MVLWEKNRFFSSLDFRGGDFSEYSQTASFLESDDLSGAVLYALWERFASPAATLDERRAAVLILGMAASCVFVFNITFAQPYI